MWPNGYGIRILPGVRASTGNGPAASSVRQVQHFLRRLKKPYVRSCGLQSFPSSLTRIRSHRSRRFLDTRCPLGIAFNIIPLKNVHRLSSRNIDQLFDHILQTSACHMTLNWASTFCTHSILCVDTLFAARMTTRHKCPWFHHNFHAYCADNFLSDVLRKG